MELVTRFTPEEYLALEAASQIKHEYWDGRIIALAGAHPNHVKIVSNLITFHAPGLETSGCWALASDLRVRISREAYVYPDLIISCEESRYTEEKPPSLLNPRILVEVTSRSTEAADHARKGTMYRQIESLQEYWIIDQYRPAVICWTRGEAWIAQLVEGPEAQLHSPHLDRAIPLSSIYRRIAFT